MLGKLQQKIKDQESSNSVLVPRVKKHQEYKSCFSFSVLLEAALNWLFSPGGIEQQVQNLVSSICVHGQSHPWLGLAATRDTPQNQLKNTTGILYTNSVIDSNWSWFKIKTLSHLSFVKLATRLALVENIKDISLLGKKYCKKIKWNPTAQYDNSYILYCT